MADSKSEDRKCPICHEDFAEEGLHRAVKLPCNHIFGESCIEYWLRPYAPWTELAGLRRGAPVGANTCPCCRRALFPKQRFVDSLAEIKARINLWDTAYETLGISMSETQIQDREDLLQYLSRYYRNHGFDEYYPSNTVAPARETWPHQELLVYSFRLKGANLTPVQENLRLKLEALARRLEPNFIWGRGDDGQMCFLREYNWVHVRLDGVLDGNSNESNESHEEAVVEEESEELAEGDSEEMRFFRNLFR